MHPYLSQKMIDERSWTCLCGARASQAHGLCRKCRHRAEWMRHHERSPRASRASAAIRRATARIAGHAARESARICALVALLIATVRS